MKALIILNGDIHNYEFMKRYTGDIDYVICADGGARHILQLQLVPDILLGDLDSISESDRQRLVKLKVMVQAYPPNKDETDAELAVRHALSKGAKEIRLIGATGSRLDHTLGNIQLLLAIAKAGARGILANENNEVYLLLTGHKITLKKEEGYKISLLPLEYKASGVKTRGLLYPMDSADLIVGLSLGISNEFVEDKAQIELGHGSLLVIKSKD